MSWATPYTAATGDVITASEWNTSTDDLTFLYGDSSWTAPTMTNSWVNAGAAFMLIGRVVWMHGAITPGTAGAAAFTLPSGYRPSEVQHFVVPTGASANTWNEVVVDTTGTVTPSNATNCWLAGVSFPIV